MAVSMEKLKHCDRILIKSKRMEAIICLSEIQKVSAFKHAQEYLRIKI